MPQGIPRRTSPLGRGRAAAAAGRPAAEEGRRQPRVGEGTRAAGDAWRLVHAGAGVAAVVVEALEAAAAEIPVLA